jgi:hypothetical protein
MMQNDKLYALVAILPDDRFCYVHAVVWRAVIHYDALYLEAFATLLGNGLESASDIRLYLINGNNH